MSESSKLVNNPFDNQDIKTFTYILGGLLRPGFGSYYRYTVPEVNEFVNVIQSEECFSRYNDQEHYTYRVTLIGKDDAVVFNEVVGNHFINVIKDDTLTPITLKGAQVKILPKRLTYAAGKPVEVVYNEYTASFEDADVTNVDLFKAVADAIGNFDARRSLFKRREQVLPYEYPHLIDYSDAIRHSYWLHSEFNYTSDVQDYHTNSSEHEKNVITRAMLAISQIEVAVKRFWGDVYYLFPKPEVDLVGGTFYESEVRHFDAYRNLLELLGLNQLFNTISTIPALQARVDYIGKFMRGKTHNREGAVLATTMFSLFVEHISLFSQFLIMMSFNKERNRFKGLSNAIEATSKEEEIHGRFGIELISILKEENPELFTEELYQDLATLAKEAFDAEMKIVDWIFDNQDLEFLSIETVKNYIRKRYNNSLVELGLEPQHLVIEEEYQKVAWFDIEVLASKENDFFNKRSTDYSKKLKTITPDDLF